MSSNNGYTRFDFGKNLERKYRLSDLELDKELIEENKFGIRSDKQQLQLPEVISHHCHQLDRCRGLLQKESKSRYLFDSMHAATNCELSIRGPMRDFQIIFGSGVSIGLDSVVLYNMIHDEDYAFDFADEESIFHLPGYFVFLFFNGYKIYEVHRGLSIGKLEYDIIRRSKNSYRQPIYPLYQRTQMMRINDVHDFQLSGQPRVFFISLEYPEDELNLDMVRIEMKIGDTWETFSYEHWFVTNWLGASTIVLIPHRASCIDDMDDVIKYVCQRAGGITTWYICIRYIEKTNKRFRVVCIYN